MEQQRADAFNKNNATTMRVKREQARAIKRILDRNSREVVGWLYEWNTGQLAVMWKDGRRDDVVYA